MVFNPGKIAALSRLLFERGVALVVVGFPATPLLTARARICISAAHTRKQLDYALEVYCDVPYLLLCLIGLDVCERCFSGMATSLTCSVCRRQQFVHEVCP
jgi:hypothetical protein